VRLSGFGKMSAMARGIVPRQPAKNGRQAGVPKQRTAGKPGVRSASKSHVSSFGSESLNASETRPAGAKLESSPPKTKKGDKKQGYNPVAPKRIQEILVRLDKQYSDVTCALQHRDAWQLLVATILSAQSTDVNVNKVTPVLFKKYPTVQDFARLKPEELQPDIYSTGFFRNKSKSVIGAAQKIVSDFGGEVPKTMDELLTLPGVARKTANVVLGTWFRLSEGVVVDTHVHRISHRLELTKQNDPKKIELDLMKIIPREKWTLFSHQVIWHGRQLCMARSPKCVECPLENICHAADKTWSTVEIHKGAKA
jgi:endonuclease III